MKAVGVIGPDFQPRLFDVDEPIPARDGVVVEVIGTSWRICCSRWQHNVFAATWTRPYPSISWRCGQFPQRRFRTNRRRALIGTRVRYWMPTPIGSRLRATASTRRPSFRAGRTASWRRRCAAPPE
jgi:hypothetical protein